jgi:hypothetical protein
MNTPMRPDTGQVATTIKELISAGVRQDERLTRVMRAFPTLTIAELPAALQDAMDAAERRVATEKRH